MAIFEQGAFQQNPNDTPETIKRKRQMIREAMMNYGSASNVGEGIGQLLNGIATGVQMRGVDRAEQAGLASAGSARSKIYDAVLGSPKPVSSTSTPPAYSEDAPISATGVDVAKRLQADFGLSPGAAAGFAGNLAHESGNFKTLQEINPTVPGSRGGFGWAQWTGPRRRAFESWSAQNGLDPSSPEANYGFLKNELQNTPEGSVLASLKGVDDPTQAAQIVSEKFLRPGIPHMGSRISKAQQIAQALMGGQGQNVGRLDPNVGGMWTPETKDNVYDPAAVQQKLLSIKGTQVASLDPSIGGMWTPQTKDYKSPNPGVMDKNIEGMAYAAQQPQSGADKVFSAIMPQTQQTAPQMPMRGGSGLDVWQGRATQGTATDGTRLTRLPNGSIQRTNRFGVTERMSPEGESMGASMGARQPMQQPQQVAQAAFNPQPVAPLAAQQPAQTGQADSAPIPMSGGLNLQELMAQAQNPWLDESSRAFANDLIQKELQKQDPAYQQAQKMKDLEYQKTQLELDQMKNPPPKWDVVTGKDGSVFRINPQTGDHEVIYGPQAEPLKPTGDIQEYEYAKKQGFTGTFAEYQQQMKKAGAQSINIDQKAEGQFDKTLAEKQAASFDTMATEGMNAKADIAVIGELGNLLKGQGGMLTGLSGALAKYGIGGEGIGDLQAADALINKLIPSQRAPGSGSMSDRDVEMFRSSLPSLWKTPGGNQILLNTMQSLAQYKQAQGDIAQRVMIGEIDRKDAVRLLRELPNPLESFRSGTQAQPSAAPQAAPQSAPAQPSAAPIKIQSIEDYNRVPSGAQYVDPQGVVRIKK